MLGLDYAELESAAGAVKARWPKFRPQVGIILGSGWSGAVESFEIEDSVPYSEVPGFGATGVEGHAGVLSWARAGGYETLLFQGRRHFYEGAGWTPISVPAYLLKSLGAELVVITNAAGGLAEYLHPGDLMALTDHINLMGGNPLTGSHNGFWGAQFADLSSAYDQDLRKILLKAARSIGEDLRTGVYCAVPGPTYETPAEVRMLKLLGADAVGMSTVPSTILAAAAGLKVLGISCITNYGAGVTDEPLAHAEVIEVSKRTMPRIKGLLSAFMTELSSSGLIQS